MFTPSLEKILYVEDDPHIQSTVSISLVDIGGFDLETCNSGEEALACICEYKPDLLLIDIYMPVLDGISLLKMIREIEEFKHTPAILISAQLENQNMLDLNELEVIGLIAKPFDPITIAKNIQTFWDYYYSEENSK